MKGIVVFFTVFFISLSLSNSSLEDLGRELFNDENLSEPKGQSCATCHDQAKGFANNKIVSPGANPRLFGNRNTPTIAYSSFSPYFKYDVIEGQVVPVGGQFLDGREDTLARQVMGPFLNPLEMNNSNINQLVVKIKQSNYWDDLIKQFKIKPVNNESIINAITKALVAYEKSTELAQFTSKYDYWLEGKVQFDYLEQKGFIVFERMDKGNCAACHTLKKRHKDDRPLLTDFSYDNIGVPANLDNPYYKMPKKYNPQGHKYIDYGLGKSPRMKSGEYLGMFKVPTLRNIEITAPYMHNGVFKTLKEVVEFYNSRDLETKWGKPEVPYNVNQQELGDLQLSYLEIDALVAFMKTLTDGYRYEK